MNTTDFLSQVASIKNDTYQSNYDGSYLTRIGMEDHIKFLADREITESLGSIISGGRGTANTGFCPKENKWYGWSHRAIYGFGIGSTCKKGDVHYRAANIEDEIEDAIRFWSSESHKNVTGVKVKDGLITVSWDGKYKSDIRSADWNYDLNFGKGEWTAKTIKDAKRMAFDFAAGIS